MAQGSPEENPEDRWVREQFGIEPSDDKAVGSVFGFRTMRLYAPSQDRDYYHHTLDREWYDNNQKVWNQSDVELRGLSATSYVWQPGENVASHIEGVTRVGPCDGIASENCDCGFYAHYDPKHALREQLAHSCVLAVVEGYGRVTLHATGFRAEKTRVHGFIALHDNDVAEYLSADPLCGCSARYMFHPPNAFVQQLAKRWDVAYYATLADAQRAVKTPTEYPDVDTWSFGTITGRINMTGPAYQVPFQSFTYRTIDDDRTLVRGSFYKNWIRGFTTTTYGYDFRYDHDMDLLNDCHPPKDDA